MCCVGRFPSAVRGALADPKTRRARRLGHRPKRSHNRPSCVGFCGTFGKRQNRRRNSATTKNELSRTPRRRISPHEKGDRGAAGPHPNTKTSADAATRRHDRHPKTQAQRQPRFRCLCKQRHTHTHAKTRTQTPRKTLLAHLQTPTQMRDNAEARIRL